MAKYDWLSKPSIKTSPRGIAVFPKLSTPDTKFNPDGDYKITLRLSAEDAAAMIEAAEEMRAEAMAAAKKNLDKPKAAKLKFADLPFKQALDSDGNETGETEFNFKMKALVKTSDGRVKTQKPIVVDAKKKPVADDVWGGSEVKVNYAMAPFFVPALGIGVSLRLRGVQVLKLVKGGASADAMFGEEDGYEAGEQEHAPEGDDAPVEREPG
jgi:hypothetical protein